MEETQIHQDAPGRFDDIYDVSWLPELDNNRPCGPPLTTAMEEYSYILADHSFGNGIEIDGITNGVTSDGLFWSLMPSWWPISLPDPPGPEQLPTSSCVYTPQSSISSAPYDSIQLTPDSNPCQAAVSPVSQMYQPTSIAPAPSATRKSIQLCPRKNHSAVSTNQSNAITLDSVSMKMSCLRWLD